MRTPAISLTLGELAPEIEARGPLSATTVRTMLDRYLAVLHIGLATVTLTVAEASLICDALNGTLTDPPETARLLWAEVDDAIQLDGLDVKWSVDGPALVAKLRGFTFAQSTAVVDACERWWHLIATTVVTDREAALKAVGLIR